MKLRFAGNMHFALPVASAFVFLITLGVFVQPSSAFAQQAAPSGRASVKLTTDPSPAQKGTNVAKVKLTDLTGQPIAGANVTVTFYMPAMPSMGMTTMRTVASPE